ncbi:hypothetical protein AAFC00_000625 [Neodothiora populina]|uniref:Uncharacterized protein n=1 Tax=Neodothiora populina TaxID=2781224 RepID=A0ABR3PDG9_9PEZI
MEGGTFIIALIIFIALRMRKGATLIEALKFRHGERASFSSVQDQPIARQQRFSIRSSRHPSMSIANRRQKEMPPLPLPVTHKSFRTKDSYYRYYWKERARPTTPNKIIQSWFMRDATPSPKDSPEMTKLRSTKGSARSHSSVARSTTMTTYKTAWSNRLSRGSKSPGISICDVSDSPATSPNGEAKAARWSWTNSEAPSTPRIALGPKRLSSASSHKYRSAGGGLGGQMAIIDESGTSPMTLSPALTVPDRAKSPEGLRTFYRGG